MSPATRTALAGSLRIGLIGGAAGLLICLVGMVVAFDEREIIAGVISLGQALLLMVFFGAGYAAAKRSEAADGGRAFGPAGGQASGTRGRDGGGWIGRGALAGLVAALVLCGLGDAGANLLFSLASLRGYISVVSVLASLYPVMTVLLARVFLHERLMRVQQFGVVAALAGVVLVSAG